VKYLIDLSIFRRNKNFSLIFIGQFVSLFGTMITSVALPFQIYSLTHSTLMVGLLSLFQLIPLIFTALLGGVYADRYNRRVMLLIAEMALFFGCLLLAFNTYQWHNIAVIFIVATIMSALTGFHRPALDSIIQQIVAKKDLPTVSAIGTFKFSVGMIVGPAIGGIIIAKYGIVFTYVFDALTFFISVFAIGFVKNIASPFYEKSETAYQALKVGIQYASSRQDLIGTYLVDFTAMIFGMPNALFPAIASQFGGPQVLGLLYSAPAVGALFVSFYGHWTRFPYHGRAIALSAMLWGVAIIFFGLSTHLYIALFFLMIAGIMDALSGIYRSVMWNQTIPNHFRGRLAGIEMISYLSGPRLGDTEAGLVAAALGVTTSIVLGGVLCVVSVALCSYCLPKFWNYKMKQDIEILQK